MPSSDIAVEMRGIVKVYPDGVVALRGVDLVVRRGEIHGVLGENGAGKTTLMRILYGEIRPTRGKILVFGEEVSFRSPLDAIRRGIAMVYQHFALIPTLTVLENLFIAVSAIRKTSITQVRRQAEELSKRLGMEIPLDAVVEDLPIGVQQRVEILKALLLGAKILILDEPTSVLTPIEVEPLFNMLRKLREEGVTVIFITHKLREVKTLANRITILRKGRVVGAVDADRVSEAELAKMMVGREVFLKIGKTYREPGPTLLRIEDLWVRDDRGLYAVRGVSLEVRAGEIVGIAGVQGNGQRELAEAIAGMRRAEKGRILLADRDVTELPPIERYRMGLAYIPDSRAVGLIYEMNVAENSILTSLHSFSRSGMLVLDGVESFAKRVVEAFEIVTPSIFTRVRYLSGGNQQKLMIGRDVARAPQILIVCEPTHGLDVNATEYVRKLLISLRDEGKAILLISSDLEEVLSLSDRIAVMYSGRIVAIGKPQDFTAEQLGLLMGGAIEATPRYG